MIRLSILMTAYNIETYIGRAIKSVLEQDMDFEYELLIGNDCSTDKTSEIINQYANLYPHIIRVINLEKNVGYSANLIFLLNQSNAEYIAQFDGDDFTIDKKKFSAQVKFLDSNPGCSICFHDYISVNDKEEFLSSHLKDLKNGEMVGTGYLVHNVLGPGNVTMIRRNSLPAIIPDWLNKCRNHVDYALHVIASVKGSVGFIKETMSAYTIHSKSITQTVNNELMYKTSFFLLKKLKLFLKGNKVTTYNNSFNKLIAQKLFFLAFFYAAKRKIHLFIFYFFRGLYYYPFFSLSMYKDFLFVASPDFFHALKKRLQ